MNIFTMAVKVASVCIYACEYMYIYIYVYVYVCVYMFICVCIYTYIHIQTYALMHLVYIYIFIYMHWWILYVYIYIYMHAYKYVCIYGGQGGWSTRKRAREKLLINWFYMRNRHQHIDFEYPKKTNNLILHTKNNLFMCSAWRARWLVDML